MCRSNYHRLCCPVWSRHGGHGRCCAPAVVAPASEVEASGSVSPVFGTNAKGQTYGSALLATNPSQAPDLILAYGSGGTLGYVKKTDLMTYQLISPAGSLDLMKAHPTGVDIPLYASDGISVLGRYHIDTSAG